MITPERWAQLKPILEPALELTPAEASAHLDEACRNDPELRAEAEAFLRATAQASHSLEFLETPAAELAAPLLALDDLAGSAPELQEGERIANYTIERRLGSGGMGVVYLAHDSRLDRRVALKLLPPWAAGGEVANRRFVHEAKAASRLDHPNVQTVHEIGETPDGRLFIAMAHYEGETLKDRLARGPLEVVEAAGIARQIAGGLAAAHSRGIVHRDIKPSNIIITPDGVAKILDFGAAQVVGPDTEEAVAGAYGTVAYMSPEQTHGGEVDARADLWSLGVVLHEMLTGERPFAASRRDEMVAAIRNDDPPSVGDRRPAVPAAIGRIVSRCLQKDAGARYQSAEELLRDLDRAVEPRLGRNRAVRWAVATSAVALLLMAGVLLAVRPPATSGAVTGAGAAIAVLPPVPVGADSALTRIGRELAVTLSANLDGMGGIRTLPALTMLAQVGAAPLSLADGGRLARRLGATSFLTGTLVHNGALVRLDVELFDAGNLTLLAQATATARAEDVTALTDSATMLILRRLWGRGTAPVPNLAAITTHSPTAMRAYLEGEVAFARGEFRSAVGAFERAYAADSTFGLAYWRSIYPRVYEGSQFDPQILAGILAHRDQVPAADRLMMDAFVAPTLGEQLQILREGTKRFPDYWPGWYGYADALYHDGPYVGNTQAEAIDAIKRVVALNPDFAPARQHLLWAAVSRRDTAAADSALAGLERFAAPDAFVYHPENMKYFRALHALVRTDGEFRGDEAMQVTGASLSRAQRVPSPEVSAVGLFAYGYPRAQLQQVEATLAMRPLPEMVAAQWMATTYIHASRGAWGESLAAAERWARLSDDPQTPLLAYGLAVLGNVSGAVDERTALRLRPQSPGTTRDGAADWLAERSWLDGVLAYVRRDPAALAHTQRQVAATGSQHAALLAASLGAFRSHVSGQTLEAARALAALEWEIAEGRVYRTLGRFHPYLSAVTRPAAARWMAESGDTIQALRLLTWHEAFLVGDGTLRIGNANRVAAPMALLERARIESALGRTSAAREHYRSFLDRYDRPPAQHQQLVADAREALRRLERGGR